jgi:hypothetical protein
MPEKATIDVQNAGDLVEAIISAGEPITDGALIARFRFAHPCTPRFSPRVSFLYSFADEQRPRKGVTRELAEIWHRAVDVVNELRPFMYPL